MRAHVHDLLDIPYRYGGTDRASGVDCLYIARQTLERIFPDLQPGELPTNEAESGDAIADARAGVDRWFKVGESAFSATALGDLVHLVRADGRAGVAVVIDDDGRLAITAAPARGSHLMPLRRVSGVVAVYRRRP